MGGRVAYLGACEVAELEAAAVFYGGNIMKALGDGPSPFERSVQIRCPVIGFFGAEDGNPSPDDVKKIAAELARLGKWHEFQRTTAPVTRSTISRASATASAPRARRGRSCSLFSPSAWIRTPENAAAAGGSYR